MRRDRRGAQTTVHYSLVFNGHKQLENKAAGKNEQGRKKNGKLVKSISLELVQVFVYSELLAREMFTFESSWEERKKCTGISAEIKLMTF